MSESSSPLEFDPDVSGVRPQESPENELGQQYPTKPFGLEGSDQTSLEKAGDAPSPMELASQGGVAGAQGPPTADQLQAQVTQVQQSSDALKQELQNRFPDLSDGQKSLLLAKLSKYQGSAGKAAALLNAPELSAEEKERIAAELQKAGHPSGLVQFLSMITGGDTSLKAVGQKLASSPQDLNPIEMLKAQYALQGASKAVNFATAVIGQGLNFVKTVMQTQI